jgi:hypothetical protein
VFELVVQGRCIPSSLFSSNSGEAVINKKITKPEKMFARVQSLQFGAKAIRSNKT